MGETGANGALTRLGEMDVDRDADHEALTQQVEASRQKIRDGVELLEHRLHERLDWRAWVRQYPIEATGIAFGVGVLLGARRYL